MAASNLNDLYLSQEALEDIQTWAELEDICVTQCRSGPSSVGAYIADPFCEDIDRLLPKDVITKRMRQLRWESYHRVTRFI